MSEDEKIKIVRVDPFSKLKGDPIFTMKCDQFMNYAINSPMDNATICKLLLNTVIDLIFVSIPKSNIIRPM